jgi:hypothetical protein
MMDTSPTLPTSSSPQANQQPHFVPQNPYLEEAKRLRRPKTDSSSTTTTATTATKQIFQQ